LRDFKRKHAKKKIPKQRKEQKSSPKGIITFNLKQLGEKLGKLKAKKHKIKARVQSQRV